MSNKTPLNSFNLNGLYFHCGQCKYNDHWYNEQPCASCVEIKQLETGGVFHIITGKCFEPEDPKFIEKIEKLAAQYASRLQELEQAHKKLRQELAQSAKELGVKVPDFDFACKEMRTHE